MKNYKVKIKKIEISDMIVDAKSEDEALKKVSDILKKCVDNNVNLSKVFDAKPSFIFEIEEKNN